MAANTPPELNIIYEDNYIIAVNKPAGLLSTPAGGETDCILYRLQKRNPEARIVHRLDKDTSGVIVMAKTKKIEVKLRSQFRRHVLYKFYVARVWGHLGEDEGEIKLPIIRDLLNNPRQKICFKTGKHAETQFQVLEEYDDSTSRLLLTPATGRTHQLRVHLHAIGHPILGDSLYAPPDVRAMASRMLLHAETLLLYHPRFHTPLQVYCKAEF